MYDDREALADIDDSLAFIRRHGKAVPEGYLSGRGQSMMLGDLALGDAASAVMGLEDNADPLPNSVHIRTDDGTLVAADVDLACSASPRGTIVFVHGFCGNRSENGLFRALSSYTARAGFHAVSYDWRGIGESSGRFPETSIEDHVADFEAVAQWTRSQVGCESLPLHAVGFSLGAAIVGLALRRQTRVDSVAYLSPAVRPRRSMWPRYNTDEIQRELAAKGVVTKPGSSMLLGRAMLEALREVDLGPDAFDLPVPLLVVHGTEDVRIDCDHTRELVARRGLGRDFGYLELPGASHSFRPAETYWRVLAAAMVSWFAGERRSRRRSFAALSRRRRP